MPESWGLDYREASHPGGQRAEKSERNTTEPGDLEARLGVAREKEGRSVRLIRAYKTLAHKRRQACEAERWG